MAEQHEHLYVSGPAGTGKSHLVEALGHRAIEQGHDVAWTESTGSTIVGIGLVAWVVVEVLVIPDHSVGATALQAFFGLLGATIVSAAAFTPVRRHYQSR